VIVSETGEPEVNSPIADNLFSRQVLQCEKLALWRLCKVNLSLRAASGGEQRLTWRYRTVHYGFPARVRIINGIAAMLAMAIIAKKNQPTTLYIFPFACLPMIV
jgi:hypothetical protein